MATPVQAGTSIEIGFKSFAWTGYIPEDGLTWKKGYNRTETHMDTDGSTRTKIRMDEYEQLSGVFVVNLTTPTANDVVFTDGDVITVTPPGGTESTWEITDASSALAAGAIKITATMIKEVSMTYTA